jgi:tRNA (cmo5U34)-methyltransferase
MSDWTFTDFGPEFDTHVAAHLPGYADVQRLVTLVAEFAVPPGGTVADLGCSTGKTAATIRDHLHDRAIDYHLYDEDPSMLAEAMIRVPTAKTHLLSLPGQLDHPDADLTVCLWLLQFVPPGQWRRILHDARTRSKPTGCMLVAAKTRHADPRWEEVAVAALDEYKTDAGVSQPDRAAKTKALRGMLYQASPTWIARDLTAAGWHNPTLLWRWHVWSLIGAWASPVPPETV